jgi:putative FmdB family regulatory protein
MPLYDYKCNKCAHQFEVLQSMKDKTLKKCPECGNNSLKKLVSGGAGLIFKGSGFYLTDYKSKSKDKKPEIKSEVKKETKDSTIANKSSITETKK